MFPHDSPRLGVVDDTSDTPHSTNPRAAKQADLVRKIMLARSTGNKAAERLHSTQLLESVRPVIKQAVKATHWFAGSQTPEDLEQIASIAVLRTVDKFDPKRGRQSFGEVAYFRARTACEQFARMHAADVHLSDGAHKGRTVRGPPPTTEPVRVISADTTRTTVDEPPGRARVASELELALRVLVEDDESSNPELMLLATERRARVLEAVRHLAPARRELVSRVYGINQAAQSVRSVAEAWGAPKSRVDRMLAKALAELRERLEDGNA